MTDLARTGDPSVAEVVVRPVTLAWFLRRAVMAIVILCVAISSVAWLMHASIDTSAEAVTATRDVAPAKQSEPVSTSSIR